MHQYSNLIFKINQKIKKEKFMKINLAIILIPYKKLILSNKTNKSNNNNPIKKHLN